MAGFQTYKRKATQAPYTDSQGLEYLDEGLSPVGLKLAQVDKDKTINFKLAGQFVSARKKLIWAKKSLSEQNITITNSNIWTYFDNRTPNNGEGGEYIEPAGLIIGESTTYALLPTGAKENDYAILSADDGANRQGLYKFDGATWGLALQSNTDIANSLYHDIDINIFKGGFEPISALDAEADAENINLTNTPHRIHRLEIWLKQNTNSGTPVTVDISAFTGATPSSPITITVPGNKNWVSQSIVNPSLIKEAEIRLQTNASEPDIRIDGFIRVFKIIE